MFHQDVLAVSNGRRRSVDVGGLALALGNQGLGHGWGGWEEREKGETRYAELLSDMYTHTHLAVSHHHVALPPIAVAPDVRRRLIQSLDSWNFEPHKLPDEEVLSCTLILFEALLHVDGMRDDVGVSLSQVSVFLRHLRKIYRTQNPYHNFQHALDVLQATQAFLRAAGMVPPVSILLEGDDRIWRPDKRNRAALISCLNNHDLFTVYIAAIGHDVGHPGFTNGFMKNAKTPLSLVYDDRSALEQMHYALLLQIMRCHGLSELLDRPLSGNNCRKLLGATVLATDMNVHCEFMERLQSLVDGEVVPVYLQKILICQGLLKCADISNPSRPYIVSKHWATVLAEEWSSQALLEKHCQLPSTVQSSRSPLAEAMSQIWFIDTFAKPLFDLMARAIPEMEPFSERCVTNLKVWEDRKAQLMADPPSAPPAVEVIHHTGIPSLQMPEDFMNAFPLTLPTQLLTPQDEAGLHVWHPVADTHNDGTSPSSDESSDSHSCDARPSDQHAVPSITTTFSSSTPPTSPSESIGSFHLSPHSEVSSSAARPSSAGSSNGACTSEAAAAMRAAYQASVRKRKSFHRNSWNSPINSAVSTSSSCQLSPGVVAADQGVLPASARDGPRLTQIAIVTAFKPTVFDAKAQSAS